MPPRIFVSGDHLEMRIDKIISEVLIAIESDKTAGLISQISFSLCWPWEKVLITTSVAGPIAAVCDALRDMRSFIKTNSAPSEWIEAFEASIAKHCPLKDTLSNPLRLLKGMALLRVPRIEKEKTCQIKLRKNNTDIPSAIAEFVSPSSDGS